MNNNSQGKYKWYIMTLSALTNAFAVAVPSMALSVMMPEIAKELNLSLFQSGVIWGAGSLPMIISSLLGGNLCNKYGPRKMLILNSILIGLAGALRGVSGNFVFLLFAVLLLGFFGPMITLSNFMNAVIWFEPRERGLANGIATLGMALGFFIGSLLSATLLSPLLHGWRNVFFLYGGVAILVGLWWMTTRTSTNEAALQNSDSGSVSFQQGMSHILKMASLWFLGVGVLGNSGALQGVLGYLPLYLQGLGWSVASTGGLLATFHIFSMAFVLPISFLADKLNAKKTLLVVTATVATVGLGLLAVLQGSAIWVPIIMAGMVRDAFMAIFFTTVSEVKGVGSAYTGLAAGLMMIFMGVGNLLAPPIGNSLATSGSAQTPLVFWAVLAGVGAVSFALSFWLERRTKE
jgi:MFS transporter, ACS family, D-galactonate transporter